MAAVFNFDACDIVEDLVVAHVDVVRHSDIDRCIFNFAENIVLNETVVAKLRENAVEASIDHPVVSDREVVSRLPHDGIAFVLRDFEPLDTKAVS